MAVLVALAALALAQAPPGISLTLSTPHPSYRLGERVPLFLRFQASAPGYYAVNTGDTARYVRISEFDSLLVEPADAVRDPLADIPAQHEAGFVPSLPSPLGAAPIVVNRYVNEFVSFRRPGRYRMTALSTRVPGVPLRSNTLEIELTAPGPGWAARKLEQAAAVLERGRPRKRWRASSNTGRSSRSAICARACSHLRIARKSWPRWNGPSTIPMSPSATTTSPP